ETRLSGTSAGAFLSYLVQVFPNFSLSAGARIDYVPLSERIHLSPRLSFSWVLTKRLTMNGAFGIYYQQMPLFLIKQDPGNAALPDPRARHLVLGFKYLLRQDIQLTLEAYDKQYTDHPMAPKSQYWFVIDDVNGDNDRFWDFGALVAEGRAYARGVELTLQKKISKKLYGLVNLTYYRARYRDLMGFWRNRLFDNRFIVCLSGGYKPSRTWEFNVRWTLAGNKAFTPVDEALSIQYGYPVVRIEDVMAGHFNDYQNFSFRVDKRFSFRRSNLIVFLGALNLFDHKNELYRFWDYYGNQYLSEYMWGAIPYVGLEFEF
ncbi:MAG: TonB-dependent receptor, partial [Candidatus Aminicenantes bacterium]|nr:TonB-dependent receptor [Candidatus Aminicenantes bacterium]